MRSAKALGTLLHLHRGTPYVYQGEELGMTNMAFGSIDDFRDIEALNHYAEAVAEGEDPGAVLASMQPMNRDNARTPMQWDDSPHAGFTAGEPWIAVNPNHAEINAAAAIADPDSVFHHYRRLIELRHDEPAVALGDFTMLLEDDPQRLRVHARARRHRAARRGQRLRRARERRRASRTPRRGRARSSCSRTPSPSRAGSSSAPWEARVYRR